MARTTTSGRISFSHYDEPNDRVIEMKLDYRIYGGDPGCYRTANGDGWPATPTEVEIQSIRVTSLCFGDSERDPTPEEATEIADWFLGLLGPGEALWDEVEGACLRDAGERNEAELDAAADAAWERRRGG